MNDLIMPTMQATQAVQPTQAIQATQSTQTIQPEALALLQPISSAWPAGEDLSYSVLFDQIREARRADDVGLAQGQWETEIKSADWQLTRSLCESALQTQTKDLQLAAWYAESQTFLNGFAGFSIGIEVITGIIDFFWNECYPRYEYNDFDERISKFEWLNMQLSTALKRVPLTAREHGGFTWLQWEESRNVENLGLRDASAKENAIADGKLSGEAFDKAIRASGIRFYQTLSAQAQQAQHTLTRLTQTLDEKFGDQAPTLKDLKNTLENCAKLASRFSTELNGGRPFEPKNEIRHGIKSELTKDSSAMPSTLSATPVTEDTHAVGPLQSRADAINALRNVADYFRLNEPQSPVTLLAERAARWAEMSLEEWLSAVIKDDGTLTQLRELLDIRADV